MEINKLIGEDNLSEENFNKIRPFLTVDEFESFPDRLTFATASRISGKVNPNNIRPVDEEEISLISSEQVKLILIFAIMINEEKYRVIHIHSLLGRFDNDPNMILKRVYTEKDWDHKTHGECFKAILERFCELRRLGCEQLFKGLNL